MVLACDEPIDGLAEKVGGLFAGHPLDDLTKPGLLAGLLFRN